MRNNVTRPSIRTDGGGTGVLPSVTGSSHLFVVESPTHALERYSRAQHTTAAARSGGGGTFLTTTTTGAASLSRRDSAQSDYDTDLNSPGCPIAHPRAIAQVLGYSWSDSYYDETPRQQRDRWMRHQTFGPVLVSEADTSSTTVLVELTPYARRRASETGARVRHRGDYDERVFTENVWSLRPGAVDTDGRRRLSDSGELATPCSYSSTIGTASDVIAVSVAAPAGRRRGSTAPDTAAPPPVTNSRTPLPVQQRENGQSGRVAEPTVPEKEAVRPPLAFKPFLATTGTPPKEEERQRTGSNARKAGEPLRQSERNSKPSLLPAALGARRSSSAPRDSNSSQQHATGDASSEGEKRGVQSPPAPDSSFLRQPRGAVDNEGSRSGSFAAPFSPVVAAATRRSANDAVHKSQRRQPSVELQQSVDSQQSGTASPSFTKRMSHVAQGRQLRPVYLDEDD